MVSRGLDFRGAQTFRQEAAAERFRLPKDGMHCGLRYQDTHLIGAVSPLGRTEIDDSSGYDTVMSHILSQSWKDTACNPQSCRKLMMRPAEIVDKLPNEMSEFMSH